MMYTIVFTKEFGENLRLYGSGRKSLVQKVADIKAYLESFGMNIEFFSQFDVKSLGGGFFRVKFIPYRLILSVHQKKIVFIELFKRKWTSDYKKYR